jgi:hypothetical protein
MPISRRQLIKGGFLTAGALATAGAAATLPFSDGTDPAGAHPGPAGDGSAQSRMGYMFPWLRGFTSPSNQQLADLAQGQLDPDERSPDRDTTIPSGYVYLGQFIDHDLTLDTAPSPAAPLDPRTLFNGRTFRFDLDSVYGGGPNRSPQLYAADRRHFLVQNPSATGVRDLPRNMGGSAILVESRNDENEIISQLHTAILMFHNRLADTMSFEQAQRQTILHYQWVVLHDFLPRIVGPAVVDGMLKQTMRRFYHPGNDLAHPMTPVEWSVAAYRFGHSMVRFDYKLNDETEDQPNDKVTVFDATGADDLHGGRPLPANRQILYGYFFRELTDTDDIPLINYARHIDPLISAPLFQLPIPGAEASGSNVLAYRNLIRGKFYGLPSGQAVAAAMGIAPIPARQFGSLGAAFAHETPLWYYILAESARATGGQTLGPVGGRIVADVFVRLLEIDRGSILNTRFVPVPPIATAAGQLTMSDLLLYAGASPPPVR